MLFKIYKINNINDLEFFYYNENWFVLASNIKETVILDTCTTDCLNLNIFKKLELYSYHLELCIIIPRTSEAYYSDLHPMFKRY